MQQYPPQYYQPPQQYQSQAYAPKTAINELDTFMSGLTHADRDAIFSNKQFAGMYGEYLNRFLFYLLQGELGAEYINSSASRREFAESLKLAAHDIYASHKQTTMSELERIQKENEELKARLARQDKKGDGK